MTAPAYRRLSMEQRRAQLISTALGLFAHRPPEEITLDDVAAAAGVSRPLVYRYFPGGKQQLYEAALRQAADALEACFDEPTAGPMTERLLRVLDRYLAFVEQHDAGFAALLAGGSVAETSRTNAIVDEVRRAAAEEILRHLEVSEPGTRLRMAVRTWIAAVEAASLIWLDEGRVPPRAELTAWMVEQFVAQLLVTASRDEESAEVVATAVATEEREGPAGELFRRLAPVLSVGESLL
ncbi:TetR/AcrR family transcriptional regulator [Streptomyces sp. WMMC897]|uniref:TetR/AcrR family transcriptional regulator n=1 Tax=Streptomyces sp. WMMC897 TaxID=3014782 RepID=UPI0022B633A0|nr:TetR/AcrR family transcriptional regulator [Streptomyces sp. WMMC897]MCZ7416563.1 TetR/AcrR family transcriptional regulator [Streptomyces sp. WMMC897]